MTAVARSYPVEGALAYAPVVTWLRSDALAVRNRIGAARLTELARILPELPSDVPAVAPPEPLPEAQQRARLFDAAASALLSAAAPTLLVADDLHLADDETLRFLH